MAGPNGSCITTCGRMGMIIPCPVWSVISNVRWLTKQKLRVVPRMTWLDPRLTPACAAFLLAACGAASAQSATGAGADRVRLELRGHVLPHCSFSGIPSGVDLGQLGDGSGAAGRQLAFQLNCNTPFAYALSSQSGSIRPADAAKQEGFLDEIPYRASLAILTDSGASLLLDCTSGEIRRDGGGCRGTSGSDTAIDKSAVLTVSWAKPEKHLMAGRYAADLRIDLGIGN
jgi:hypothetical protein